MPKIDYHIPVNASLQTIWTILLDRVEHPERYLAGVEHCTFPENTDEYALRELQMAGIPLKERITIDEQQGEVRYQLIDHPLFEGDVYNALIPPAPDDIKATPIVQFRMDWRAKNDEAHQMEAEAEAALGESLQQAVRYVRDLAEHMEREAVKNSNASASRPS